MKRRDALIERARKIRGSNLDQELAALRDQLVHTEGDPIDHLETLLRDYELAVEAALDERRQRRSKYVRAVRIALGVSLGLATFALTLPIARVSASEPCAASDQCRHRGACSAEVRFSKLRLERRCVAADEDDCRQACKLHGHCAFESGTCVARDGRHCAQSDDCHEHGACSYIEGDCQAADTRDCARSVDCRENGLCTLSDITDHRACVAAQDTDCLRSKACQERGLCFATGTHCVRHGVNRLDIKQCWRLMQCVQSGFCKPKDWDRRCDVLIVPQR